MSAATPTLMSAERRRFGNCASNMFRSSAVIGCWGSARVCRYVANSSACGSPSSISFSRCPLPARRFAARSSDLPLRNSSLTSSSETPQWSASNRSRTARIPARSPALRASMTRSHSVSAPIDRLFRLAEPTRRKVSSITITLECTMVLAVFLPALTCGYTSRMRALPSRQSVCAKWMRPGRMVRYSTQLSARSGATIRTSRFGFFLSRRHNRSANSMWVRNWFSM